jgi:alanyl-tRNA synthetase
VREGPLRLIEVADFDLSACGGTHVSRTGEIGVVLVRASERFRGGTRVTFVCGRRAVASYRELLEAADGAARALTIHPRELPVAVERLQDDNKALRRDLKDRDARLATYVGRELAMRARVVRGARVVVDAVDGDAETLKRIARAAVDSPTGAAVVWSIATPSAIVAARGEAVNWLDCGALVKHVCQQLGGRGGGRPDFAQGGGITAAGEAIASVVEEVLAGAGR